jgi:hypothetical protein
MLPVIWSGEKKAMIACRQPQRSQRRRGLTSTNGNASPRCARSLAVSTNRRGVIDAVAFLETESYSSLAAIVHRTVGVGTRHDPFQ